MNARWIPQMDSLFFSWDLWSKWKIETDNKKTLKVWTRDWQLRLPVQQWQCGGRSLGAGPKLVYFLIWTSRRGQRGERAGFCQILCQSMLSYWAQVDDNEVVEDGTLSGRDQKPVRLRIRLAEIWIGCNVEDKVDCVVEFIQYGYADW